MSRIERVTLLMAMQAEAAPLVQRLGLTPSTPPWPGWLPCRLWRGRIAGLAIELVTSGVDPRYGCDNIGLEPAAVMALAAIEHLRPELLVSAGTAGGFAARGAVIGTVYLSAGEFRFHDRHVGLAGFEASALGGYPALSVRALAAELGLPQGPVSSGSSLRRDEAEVAALAASGVVAKEMEAAAAAWVASLAGVPFVAVKAITNLLDVPGASEAQFVDNLAAAVAALTATLQRLLPALEGRTVANLGEQPLVITPLS